MILDSRSFRHSFARQIPTQTAAISSPTPVDVVLYDLPGLAYHRSVATSGLGYDLMYSVTAPFPPSGGIRFSDVYRLDTASGATVRLAQLPAIQRDAQVFADPRGRLMVVATQADLALVRQSWSELLSGPPLEVVSALFLGPAESATIVVSTPQSVVDVTLLARPRTLANVGGTLLGQLDDGRLVSSLLLFPIPGARRHLDGSAKIASVPRASVRQRSEIPTLLSVSHTRASQLRTEPGSAGVAALDRHGSDHRPKGLAPMAFAHRRQAGV